eukprot:gene27187-35916_t
MVSFKNTAVLFLFFIGEFISKKCLLISIDNRNLNPRISESNYATISAVITLSYAQRHGYDFLYLQEDMDGLVDEVFEKYGDAIYDKKLSNKLNSMPKDYFDGKSKRTPNEIRQYSKSDMMKDLIPPTNVAKDEATAFHAGLLQFRAASWAKLPALWHIVDTIGHQYEYIWYIDSDATVSPLHANISIEQKILSWETESSIDEIQQQEKAEGSSFEVRLSSTVNKRQRTSKGRVAYGNKKVSQSAFIFFNNHPWRDDMPCAGSFILRPNLAEPILREWDKSMCVSDWKQSFKMNSTVYSIVNERQFPSNWQRYEDLWLCHVASYNYLLRMPILSRFLNIIDAETEKKFSALVAVIAKNNLRKVKLLGPAESMEKRSKMDKNRLLPDAFPAHDEKTQSAFYDAHVSAADQAVFGFSKELAFQVSASDVSQISSGSTILRKSLLNKHMSGDYEVVESPTSKKDVGGGKGCDVDHDLERAVLSNGSRSILYLISHDNNSDSLGRKFSQCKERWVKSVRIPNTVFFESIIYREIFPKLRTEWESLDFVITGTYKTVAKQLHYNGFTQNQAQIKFFLDVAKNGQYDVVPFLRSGSGTMSFCMYWHGKPFKEAWTALLNSLGYSTALIRSLDEVKPFYRNIFIIRPAALVKLMQFMDRAMYVAENNLKVKELLQKDAKYKEGQEEVALRVFNTKYYQLHPFIFERLPSFFLHAENMTICHGPDGPCKYNS